MVILDRSPWAPELVPSAWTAALPQLAWQLRRDGVLTGVDRVTYDVVEVDVDDEFARVLRDLGLKALADSPVFDSSTGLQRRVLRLRLRDLRVLVVVVVLMCLYAALPQDEAPRALLQLLLDLLLAGR